MEAGKTVASAQVEFHTGVADPPLFAARLLHKAHRLGTRVLVTAPARRLQVLDRLLWTVGDDGFVPHAVLASAAPRVWQRSPFWLAEQLGQAFDAAASAQDPGLPPVWINLGADDPVDAGRFSRWIEIVGIEADEVAAGRERWRAWKAAGVAVRHLPAGGA